MSPSSLDLGVYGARGIPSTYSGFETFLTTLLPELVRRGHRVTMYCRKGEVEPAESFEGVRLVHLPAVRSKSLSTLTHGAVAGTVARRARHDVVLTVNVANALYCALARRTGQPVVLNTDGQEWLRGKWGPAARTYFRTSARMAGRTANALVSDCLGMQGVYRREFHADSTVIPYCWNGVDAAPTDVLDRLGLTARGFLLTGGRLVPENNIAEIAEAHVRGGPDVPMLVLGAANYDSPVVSALTTLAARDERIRLGGHVGDRADYQMLLREAALYVHGHSVGGINPSLVEAMGAGARVAALDTPFNAEALGGTGRLFSDFTAELPALLRAVVEADADEADATARAAGRERAHAQYTLTAIADAYEALLRVVASGELATGGRMPTRWDPSA